MTLPSFEFGEADLKHAEGALRASYAAEIDRKDKILASMRIITPAITVLLAVATFVFSNIIDANAGYFVFPPDPLVWLVLAVAGTMLFFMGRIALFFQKLLAAENYHYMPEGDAVLKYIRDMQAYCREASETADSLASRLVREAMLPLYAVKASANCAANDARLRYRQRVFTASAWTMLFAAAALLLVALHRAEPHLGRDVIRSLIHA